MRTDERPPPVVTIVDPAHPGPLGELVVGGETALPARPSVVQFLAGALSVLLLIGITAAGVQRHDQAEAERLTAEALAGVRLSVGVSGLSNDARQVGIGYDVISRGAEPVELLSAGVTGAGWSVAGELPRLLTSTTTASLALVRELDCTEPRPPQPVLRVTVRVREGTRVLEVAVPQETPLWSVRIVDALCGQIDAAQAVSNSTAVASQVGDRLVVDLELVNTSVYPVHVTGVIADGLAVTGLRLPILLAARPPGPLDLEVGVSRRPVRFQLELRECLKRGQLRSRARGHATGLDVTSVGRGRDGSAYVPVSNLDALLRELIERRCPPILR